MPDDSAEKQFERLRPDRVSSPDQIPDFLDRFVRDVVRCPTHESCWVTVEKKGSEFRISGWAPYPATLEAFKNLWNRSSFSSEPVDLSVLPTITETSGGPFFGISAARLVGKATPDPGSPVAHIWESGSPIRPLHPFQGFILCQSETGYLGWVDEGALSLRDEPSDNLEARPPQIERARVEGIVFPWLGTPYDWGGSGSSGIDCSGFSQFVYKELGYLLPRDANQQMLGGRLVATHDRRGPLEPGDLLFFTLEDGRIGHVAISLGDWKAIHAERPEVCVFSLREGAADYNPVRSAHFAFAKRYFL